MITSDASRLFITSVSDHQNSISDCRQRRYIALPLRCEILIHHHLHGAGGSWMKFWGLKNVTFISMCSLKSITHWMALSKPCRTDVHHTRGDLAFVFASEMLCIIPPCFGANLRLKLRSFQERIQICGSLHC